MKDTINLKRYKAPVKKLILNHFGAAMLGIMLLFAGGSNFTLDLITSIFAVVFYMIICYTAMWDLGARDKVSSSVATYDKTFAIKATLLANIPSLLISFVVVISKALGAFASISFFDSVAWFTNMLARFWFGMYTGIINFPIQYYLGILQKADPKITYVGDTASFLFMLMYIATVIPAFIVCPLGYKMGYKGIRIIPEKKKEK